jgi:hypothetical protein
MSIPCPDDSLIGRLHVFLAFDFGDEIDLERVRRLVAAQPHVLPRRPRTPTSIAFHPPPMRLRTTPLAVELPELGQATAAAEVTLFDFAAVSFSLRLPFEMKPDQLVRLTAGLAEPARIVATARRALEPLFELLKPAITEPSFSSTSEEYFVFELPPGPPLPMPSQLLGSHGDWLAGLVRLETGPLSHEEIGEALRQRLSYTPEDLFVAEWSAAVLIDRDCEETLETIEFANLQLLEFRYTDHRLDQRLADAYRLIHPLSRSWLPFWQTYARPLRELGDLRIEANSVFERAGNVLKLIGDQYLARVYRILGARFHLDAWQNSIERSLSTVQQVYQVVSDQAATYRTEFLELTIVVLIAVEIVLSFLR